MIFLKYLSSSCLICRKAWELFSSFWALANSMVSIFLNSTNEIIILTKRHENYLRVDSLKLVKMVRTSLHHVDLIMMLLIQSRLYGQQGLSNLCTTPSEKSYTSVGDKLWLSSWKRHQLVRVASFAHLLLHLLHRTHHQSYEF